MHSSYHKNYLLKEGKETHEVGHLEAIPRWKLRKWCRLYSFYLASCVTAVQQWCKGVERRKDKQGEAGKRGQGRDSNRLPAWAGHTHLGFFSVSLCYTVCSWHRRYQHREIVAGGDQYRTLLGVVLDVGSEVPVRPVQGKWEIKPCEPGGRAMGHSLLRTCHLANTGLAHLGMMCTTQISRHCNGYLKMEVMRKVCNQG